MQISEIVKDIDLLLTMLEGVFKGKEPGIIRAQIERLRSKLKKISSNNTPLELDCDLTFNYSNKEVLKIPPTILEKIENVVVILRVKINEKALEPIDISDCILQDKKRKYGVQIIASSKIKDENSRYKISWHLDKHIRNEDDSDGEGKGLVHPEYHFNMGGFGLTKDSETNYGNVLVLDAPRLMHPPLDIVLTIDFVLRNFYGTRLMNLLKSKQYLNIVNRAKRRLWRPYFLALADSFEPTYFTDKGLTIQSDYAAKLFGDI